MSLVCFANNFLSLLSGQTLLSLDFEFDKFSVLFGRIHLMHFKNLASALMGGKLSIAPMTFYRYTQPTRALK